MTTVVIQGDLKQSEVMDKFVTSANITAGQEKN